MSVIFKADVAGDAGPSQQDSWERKRNAESDGAQERRAEELNVWFIYI